MTKMKRHDPHYAEAGADGDDEIAEMTKNETPTMMTTMPTTTTRNQRHHQDHQNHQRHQRHQRQMEPDAPARRAPQQEALTAERVPEA